MNASAKTGSKQAGARTVGPEVLESAAALGREALERTMRMTAEATIRACRGAAAAGTAQLEAAQFPPAKMGGGRDYVSALSASSEAAIAGMETCMEQAIDFTRAATDAGVETAGRALTARTLDDWIGVQVDSASRMMNLGLTQAGELTRIVTETSTRCMEPLTGQVERTGKAS